MISNVCNWSIRCPLFLISRYHICKVSLPNFDVYAELLAKGLNLHVVAIGASLSHLLQMALKNSIDLFGRRGPEFYWGRERPSRFPLWIPTNATTRIDIDE